MDNELFKLITRRWVALPIVFSAIVGALFLIYYGTTSGSETLAAIGATALFVEFGTVIGFYFKKKKSDD